MLLALKLATTAVISFLLLEFLLLVFNDAVFHSSFVIYDKEMGFLVRPYARRDVATEISPSRVWQDAIRQPQPKR